jgi:hypothetical protein
MLLRGLSACRATTFFAEWFLLGVVKNKLLPRRAGRAMPRKKALAAAFTPEQGKLIVAPIGATTGT